MIESKQNKSNRRNQRMFLSDILTNKIEYLECIRVVSEVWLFVKRKKGEIRADAVNLIDHEFVSYIGTIVLHRIEKESVPHNELELKQVIQWIRQECESLFNRTPNNFEKRQKKFKAAFMKAGQEWFVKDILSETHNACIANTKNSTRWLSKWLGKIQASAIPLIRPKEGVNRLLMLTSNTFNLTTAIMILTVLFPTLCILQIGLSMNKLSRKDWRDKSDNMNRNWKFRTMIFVENYKRNQLQKLYRLRMNDIVILNQWGQTVKMLRNTMQKFSKRRLISLDLERSFSRIIKKWHISLLQNKGTTASKLSKVKTLAENLKRIILPSKYILLPSSLLNLGLSDSFKPRIRNYVRLLGTRYFWGENSEESVALDLERPISYKANNSSIVGDCRSTISRENNLDFHPGWYVDDLTISTISLYAYNRFDGFKNDSSSLNDSLSSLAKQQNPARNNIFLLELELLNSKSGLARNSSNNLKYEKIFETSTISFHKSNLPDQFSMAEIVHSCTDSNLQRVA